MKHMRRHLHKRYGNRPLWQWFLLYFVIAGMVYASIYNFYDVNTDSTDTPGTKTTTQNQQNIPPKNTTTPINVEKQFTYEEALAMHQGRRIQFSETCVASPSKLSINEGTSILLDNRSSAAKPIYLDGVQHNLSAYGYKIVKIATGKTLPHTMRIDCGTGKGNASIIIQ